MNCNSVKMSFLINLKNLFNQRKMSIFYYFHLYLKSFSYFWPIIYNINNHCCETVTIYHLITLQKPPTSANVRRLVSNWLHAWFWTTYAFHFPHWSTLLQLMSSKLETGETELLLLKFSWRGFQQWLGMIQLTKLEL